MTRADNVATANVNATYRSFYLEAKSFWKTDGAVDASNEVRLSGGYTVKDLIVDGIAFDVGATAYVYPGNDTSKGDSGTTFEPYVGVVFEDLLFTPAAYVFYDINREALTLEGSVRESFTTENKLPFLGQVKVTPVAFFGYTDIKDVTPKGVNTSDAYTYAGGKVDVSVEVKGFVVSAGPRLTLTDGARFADNELYYGTQVSYQF